jgi:hypothetical protein
VRASLKKSIALSLAALMLGASLAASATPASAKMFWPHPFHHHGFGPGFGLGIGLGVLGAVAASQYDPDPCVQYRPIYDRWGNYLGRQAINVC